METPTSTPKDPIPASQTPQASAAQSKALSATPIPSEKTFLEKTPSLLTFQSVTDFSLSRTIRIVIN
jgi:hypothetical protein